MVPNPSLSYVDYVGILPNKNCTLKHVITSVHVNIFSHARKSINLPQSIASTGTKRERDCNIFFLWPQKQ